MIIVATDSPSLIPDRGLRSLELLSVCSYTQVEL
jgi:hypothetical protein